MKIAHIAPPWISIPPKNYGGTENVIYSLIEEQVVQKHEVTLFAPGDAVTSAKHIAFYPQSLTEIGVPWQAHLKAYYHLHKAVKYLQSHLQDFDIVHSHLSSSADMYIFPLMESLPIPHVTTLHSQFPFDHTDADWLGDADQYYMEWLTSSPLVAISERARRRESEKFPLNFVDVIYHGIDIHDCPRPTKTAEEFFVWLGRIVPDKGVHLAIEAAKKAKVPLIIAGIVDNGIPEACEYFQKYVEPEIDGKQIQYIGPVNQEEKMDLLRRAKGFLNPIQWEEPFGMVMIEAMATGCPVISFQRGAAEEIIKPEEKIGCLVQNVEEMVECMQNIDAIDRLHVRDYVDARFSAHVMVQNYVRVYQRVVKMKAQQLLSTFSGQTSMTRPMQKILATNKFDLTSFTTESASKEILSNQ